MKQQGMARHLVSPRTLLFLERDEKWLFIKGAAHKWWAGKLNGIGGSVEAGEDILNGARREAKEETGLSPEGLELAAIIHIMGDPAVLLFVFMGSLPPGTLSPCNEGTFHWLPRQAFTDRRLPLMVDLPFLLPRLWARVQGSPPYHFIYDLSNGFRVHEGK